MRGVGRGELRGCEWLFRRMDSRLLGNDETLAGSCGEGFGAGDGLFYYVEASEFGEGSH